MSPATGSNQGEAGPLRIVDGHAHVASRDYIPDEFTEGVVQNLLVRASAQGVAIQLARMRDLVYETLNDPDCEQLRQQMDAAGIAHTVLLLPDFSYALRGAGLTIAEQIERHGQVLRRHPGRFSLLVGVDPRWGTDAVTLFERTLQSGIARGLKLYPPCGYSPSDRALYPFYELCRSRNLPVLLHTGGTSPALDLQFASPLLVDAAAREFPEVRFILAHASGTYAEECVMLASSRPNVFLDVSGCAGHAMARLSTFCDQGVTHKLIFGTDWPVFRMQFSQGDLVRSVLSEAGPVRRMPSWQAERFLHGTIRELLKLDDDSLNLHASRQPALHI